MGLWVGLCFILFLILVGSLSISTASKQGVSHPIWIDNIEKWWSNGKISDKEFVDAYSYLIDDKVIAVQSSSGKHDSSFAEKIQETKTLATYLGQDSHVTIPEEKPITYLEQPETGIIQENPPVRNLPPSGIQNYFLYVVPTIQWSEDPNVSLGYATNYWQKVDNVNFNLVSDPDQASITIRWIKESDGPYSGYIVSNSIIEVGLGDSRCNGIWHQYDSDFITALVEHELGHALGYKHSNDPTNIMYPLIHNARYAPFEETFTLSPSQPIFIPACSLNDISSIHYKITGNSNNQFNAFFVDSEKQYFEEIRGHQFSYYQQDGCHVFHVNNHEGMCKNVSPNSGLIVVPDKNLNSNQRVTVFIEELL